MNIKAIKIRTQLMLAFGIIFCCFLLLGAVVYVQTDKIYVQGEQLYLHPLQVVDAIGDLYASVLEAMEARHEAVLCKEEMGMQEHLDMVTLETGLAEKALDTIRSQYLGPVTDVDKAYEAFLLWQAAGDSVDQLIRSGEMMKAGMLLSEESELSVKKHRLIDLVMVMDTFAAKKSTELLNASLAYSKALRQQLSVILFSVAAILIFMSYMIIRGIGRPLKEIRYAITQFHQGDMTAFSPYAVGNEFGKLSSSINALMRMVQKNTALSEKAALLAEVMQKDEDSHAFFQETLGALITHTGAQMASVYLLSEDKAQFEHFESIGLSLLAKEPFKSGLFEGEFGMALRTQEIQYLQDISEENRFAFHTTSGSLAAREIISIPIVHGSQVIAMVSLATVGVFLPDSIALLRRISGTLNARVAGVFAYRTIKTYQETLELKNQQLTAQKVELSAQTAELTQQNIELELQKKRLDEVSRLKTNFLSNMSHELRTPLNSIIALSGVLSRKLQDRLPAVEYSYLEIIERNGKNLLLIINNILDISRIESGREEVEITKFNLRFVINETMALFHPIADQKTIELINAAENKDIVISSDADKCKHILQNLIGNATKFTEYGRVSLTAEQRENTVEITVKDSGIGISSENLQHVFDEFRQADGSTSRRFGGTGLGLAIAKKYATLLGGTITVKSELNRGSEFSLILPLAYHVETKNRATEPALTLQKHDKMPAALADRDRKPLILVVEDNPDNQITVRALLGEHYELIEAITGDEAVKMAERYVPDLILMDIALPGITGIEAFQAIREASKTSLVPVIALTASTMEDQRESILAYGFDAYVSKPIIAKEFYQAIKAVLYGR